jgi:hypothetical protein
MTGRAAHARYPLTSSWTIGPSAGRLTIVIFAR